MKDEKTLKEVITTLSNMTGKKVSQEQEEKIIKTVINDNVPTNIDKYYE
jgi:transcriptional regulator CtsR